VAHRLLWLVAIAMAATALVAGCLNVNVPEGPYVVAGNKTVGQPSPATRDRLQGMDHKALEDEVLRLTAVNDNLKVQNDNLKRENKLLKSDCDRYKAEAERLRSLKAPTAK
jgi:hypothetical protein